MKKYKLNNFTFSCILILVFAVLYLAFSLLFGFFIKLFSTPSILTYLWVIKTDKVFACCIFMILLLSLTSYFLVVLIRICNTQYKYLVIQDNKLILGNSKNEEIEISFDDIDNIIVNGTFLFDCVRVRTFDINKLQIYLKNKNYYTVYISDSISFEFDLTHGKQIFDSIIHQEKFII